MAFSIHSTHHLKITPQTLKHLEFEHYCPSELFQEIFSKTYLLPFDRDSSLVLKEKEFEIVDPSICRVTHGAMHAARVASYVKVLHVFRSHLFPAERKRLEPLGAMINLNDLALVHLTQVVGCLHDAARRAEVTDRWDKQSAELCFSNLRLLFPDLDEPIAATFSKMIEHKDDPEGFISFVKTLKYSDEIILAWNYLRELIHDADCLDIIRVRKNFDLKYLDLLKQINHPVQATSLLDLVSEIADLIHQQADMYKDVTIHHPFDLKKEMTKSKNFSIAIKVGYEHAPNVYLKILNDMSSFSWLKTTIASCPKVAEGKREPIVSYPSAALGKLFEDLVVFKKNECRIFHGGPSTSKQGLRWVMPVAFIEDQGRVRSAFELCFVNCDPFETSSEPISFYEVSIKDLDLKTKNFSLDEVRAFYELLNGTSKAIILREADILNVCYPHMYNMYLHSEKKPTDKEDLLFFLKEKIPHLSIMKQIGLQFPIYQKMTTPLCGIIERKKCVQSIGGSHSWFFVEHSVDPTDPWGSYYSFSLASEKKLEEESTASIRIDSGCTTGMVYLDELCSCQKEFEEGLQALSQSSVLIHIPAHDGRGMGMAPKGETEIYKRGGKGKLHTTSPMDDTDAAKFLYQSENIDIRTYEGAIAILADKGIKQVRLVSRSRSKKEALERSGIRIVPE